MNVIPPIPTTDTGSFTRASTKLVFNSSGLLEQIAIDAIPWNYDPADLTKAPALLLESAATNLLTYSSDFRTTAEAGATRPWSQFQTTITPNAVTAPDGTLTAQKIVCGNNGSSVYTRTYNISGLADNSIASFGVFFKAGEVSSGINITFYDKSNTYHGTKSLNLSTGALTGINYACTSSAVDCGNGWWLLKMEACSIASGATTPNLRIVFTGTGNGSNGFFAWLAQTEVGPALTSPIPTVAAQATRSADVWTGMMLSNVTEDDYTEWDAGTTYALGDIRKYTAGGHHWIIESLQAGNIGHVPTGLKTDTWWLLTGYTNKWAMFDLIRDTPTIVASPLLVALKPGVRFDSVGLLGMVANAAAIRVSVDGVEKYAYSTSLNTREVAGWYDYFFTPFSTQPSLARFDLPPYTGAIIEIALTATSGNVECGAAVIGRFEYIGDVQYEAESDVLNFSTVTRDFDGGIATLVQRRNVPKTIQQIFLAKSRVNRVRKLRDNLNASPAVWAGLDDSGDGYFEALLILGVYKRFSINLRYPEHAILSLELEEI